MHVEVGAAMPDLPHIRLGRVRVEEPAKTAAADMETFRRMYREFKDRYSQPGAKRYADWRSVFRKAVRANWLRLWYLDGDTYVLTTAGQQARKFHGEGA